MATHQFWRVKFLRLVWMAKMSDGFGVLVLFVSAEIQIFSILVQ